VQKNPTLGFTLILQLTGVNGSHQFDRLTKTKTVESILASMDTDGIKRYIDYLLQLVNEDKSTTLYVAVVFNPFVSDDHI
jgi:DNA polymerase phi